MTHVGWQRYHSLTLDSYATAGKLVLRMQAMHGRMSQSSTSEKKSDLTPKHRWLVWGESVGRPKCVYLKRWVLDLKIISFRLHHWLNSDDQRHFHDHSWWFITLILQGGYIDISLDEAGNEVNDDLYAGDYRFRPAEYRHKVYVDPDEGCWSFLITGPRVRQFGFWVKDKFLKSYKYFYKYGHHQCD